MSAAEPAVAVKAKPKRKKLVILLVAIVLLIAVAAAAAFFVIKSRSHAAEEGEGEETVAAHAEPVAPPTFLPLENMVVNLADPGGERFAQVGVTLELADAKTADKVKVYLPAIRSGILLLISQRTADDLLKRDGKNQLAIDIQAEVARPLGFVAPTAPAVVEGAAKAAGKKKDKGAAPEENPVKKVLFSSFIIQ